MDDLAFTALRLRPCKDARDWRVRYGGSIRVAVDWRVLLASKPPVNLVQMRDDHEVYGTWYEHGGLKIAGWKDDGRPVRLRLGREPVIVRVPAFRVRGDSRVLVVDGHHRITQLRPAVVYLDVLTISPRVARTLTDMQHDFWRPWGKR